jgi:predicted amidohydrolase
MSLKITVIQSNLHWENIQANLEMFEEKINSIEGQPEIVVLPEMFSTGFSMNPSELAETMDGSAVQWMKKISREKRIVLTGSLMIRENEEVFNRLLWVLPNGNIGFYDKRHLFGFAGEDAHYQRGMKRFIASVKGWKINLQICYDLRFPVWARQQVQNGEAEYDVLVYVANWPERRSQAWKTLLQARAIENQCYVVGVNRVGNDGNNIYHSGDSMIVDPMGSVLEQAEHEEKIFTVTLDRNELDGIRSKLPFLKDADQFLIHT